MGDSFPRVNHSLRADRAITSSGVLVTALILLTAWAMWAVRASIPQYQVSGSARLVVSPSGTMQLFAQFPSAAAGELHQGEPAIFRRARRASLPRGAITARVSGVDGEVRNGQVRVEFLPGGRLDPGIDRQLSFPGSVEVEVKRVTPAVLLLRSAGQRTGGR